MWGFWYHDWVSCCIFWLSYHSYLTWISVATNQRLIVHKASLTFEPDSKCCSNSCSPDVISPMLEPDNKWCKISSSGRRDWLCSDSRVVSLILDVGCLVPQQGHTALVCATSRVVVLLALSTESSRLLSSRHSLWGEWFIHVCVQVCMRYTDTYTLMIYG